MSNDECLNGQNSSFEISHSTLTNYLCLYLIFLLLKKY